MLQCKEVLCKSVEHGLDQYAYMCIHSHEKSRIVVTNLRLCLKVRGGAWWKRARDMLKLVHLQRISEHPESTSSSNVTFE